VQVRTIAETCACRILVVAKQRRHCSCFHTKCHVTQQLLPPNCEKRHHCCEWLFAKLEDDPRMLDVTFFFYSDETWFHYTGYVNSQNTRIWSTENPHAAYKTPLHLSRLECGVQCLAVGLLGTFSSKTPLTRSATLTQPMST
jgi:hypothetical protein